MINAILGIGLKFGFCYIVVMGILLAIGLWKYGYEKKGFFGAVRETSILIFAGIGIVSAIIFIITFAFFGCCAIGVLFAKTDIEFVCMTIGFLLIAIISAIIVFISYEMMKKCDIDYEQEEEIEEKDEDLIDIASEENIKIKDLVGGWYYWDRMDNRTKNKYIKQYKATGKIIKE